MIRSFAQEFRDFLLKQNALALAVGVVIGAAVGKVVSGIVDNLFMPIIGYLLPGGEWRNLQLVLDYAADGKPANAIRYGDMLGRLLDFFIVSVVVFMVLKLFLREKPKPNSTRACPRCLELVPLSATRCRACTSEL